MYSDFDIVQLVYCSHATNSKNRTRFECDVHDFLGRSHSYNSLHDITSALLTDGELFAQVIEGSSVAVERLYSRIIRDGRHNRITTLQHVLVHVRLLEFRPIAFSKVDSLLHARTLDAWSKPDELRKASISVFKALLPVLLEQH